MSKESWCVRLKDRSVIVCVRVGKTVCNILKGGGLEKWGGETKLKKKRGKSWVKVWVPWKGWRGWNHLTNYVVFLRNIHLFINLKKVSKFKGFKKETILVMRVMTWHDLHISVRYTRRISFKKNSRNFNCRLSMPTKAAEAHSEPIQTSKVDLWAKIINGFQQLAVLAKSSTWDIWLGSECASEFFRELELPYIAYFHC